VVEMYADQLSEHVSGEMCSWITCVEL
jgi:hypothetical protein